MMSISYGEGEIFLGKRIPTLTEEEKQEIEALIAIARSAEHGQDENLLRRDFAFRQQFGIEAFIVALGKFEKELEKKT